MSFPGETSLLPGLGRRDDDGSARTHAGDLHDGLFVLSAVVVYFPGRMNRETAGGYRGCAVWVELVSRARPPSTLHDRNVARFGMPVRAAHRVRGKLRADDIKTRFARVTGKHDELDAGKS